mgnify:FL=1
MKSIDKLLKLSDEAADAFQQADDAFQRFEEADDKVWDAIREAMRECFGSDSSKFQSGKAELTARRGTAERAWVVTACPDSTSNEGWVSATDEELGEGVRKVFAQLDPCVEADLRFAIDKVKRP